MIEDLDGQIIGKVEIGERSAHPTPTELPALCIFFHESVAYALALLRLHSLFFHLRIESLRRDDPPAKEFIPHPAADLRRQHGILGDQQVDLQDLGGFRRSMGMRHGSYL